MSPLLSFEIDCDTNLFHTTSKEYNSVTVPSQLARVITQFPRSSIIDLLCQDFRGIGIIRIGEDELSALQEGISQVIGEIGLTPSFEIGEDEELLTLKARIIQRGDEIGLTKPIR